MPITIVRWEHRLRRLMATSDVVNIIHRQWGCWGIGGPQSTSGPNDCLYTDDQIGQDRRLPIAENPAATGCPKRCKSSTCERANERMRRVNVCFLCILASGIWTSVAISLLSSSSCRRHLCRTRLKRMQYQYRFNPI